MVEDSKDFWNKLDNRNGSSGSIGQSNFCELNEDMEESDKAPEEKKYILNSTCGSFWHLFLPWKYVNLLDKLDKNIWRHFQHICDHFSKILEDTLHRFDNGRSYLNLQAWKNSEV